MFNKKSEMEMEGVCCSRLAVIPHSDGDILRGLRSSDASFSGFGEAYFSFVKYGSIKGWKLHERMKLNLIVPHGEVKFVIFDDRVGSATKGEFRQFCLSPNDFYRLSIEPNLWFAFQGRSKSVNIVLNIASIVHDPDESIKMEIERFPFDWTIK